MGVALHISTHNFIVVALGNENNPQNVFIGTTLNIEESKELINLLNEFKDVFAWSYDDMPGVIVQHHILPFPNSKPIKQKLRLMRLDWVLNVKEEVEKKLKARFWIVTEYSEWVANIVPIPKKDGRIKDRKSTRLNSSH